jgi:hypothetical protein
MKIIDFVRQIAPSFRRDDVAEKLRLLRECLEEQTLPPYRALLEEPIAGKSKAVQDYEKEFARYVHTQHRGNWIEVTNKVLTNISANMSVFESLVEKNYAKDIIASGVTFKKAEILRVIAFADFVVTYSRQHLLYMLAAEANVEAKTLQNGKERPLPELTWLNVNKVGYFKAMGVMAMSGKELVDAISDIPEVIINEDSATSVEQTIGKVKVDPFAANLIPVTWNPFYYIGVRMANRELARINRAKQEKRALEFRLEQLRQQKRGEHDAKLEKTIEFYEDEVNLLMAKIAKYEE